MFRVPRAGEHPELLSDGLLALALTVFAQLDLRFDVDQSTHYGSGFAAAAATAVATAAIALRRRAPLLTVCVVAMAAAVPELVTRLTITLWGDFVPMLIALYSVARHARGRVALAGAAATALAMLVVMLRVPVIRTAADIPFTFVPFTGAFVVGRVLRRRHDSHIEASDRARRLESERDETIRAAIAQERNRIARELHDIVAHCVSVMVVQAGAAEDLLERNPPLARPPLRLIQETGRQAVGELGRMLGLLRGERAELALEPQPGTAQLGELVEHMSDSGLPVVLQVEGTARLLPAGIELAVYRIAQEALTNTLKHAGPAKARVVLRYADHAVELDVLDDGRSTGAPAPGTGHGLIGIRERVTIYGGSLETRQRPEGGFAVRAVLPMDGAAQ